MAIPNPTSNELKASSIATPPFNHFLVWREFLWGGIAGAFGEGMIHPVDTVKTRVQSQVFASGTQSQKGVLKMVGTVWAADGVRGKL